ncbi:MAG: hypothetical protein KF878_18050 [Planctomycetes bacterium]|nr:hypothetical protein [Planctomycetota bacterium]
MRRARRLAAALVSLAAAAAALAQDAAEPAGVRRARDELPRLQRRLEDLRGARFRRDVALGGGTVEELRAYLRRELDEDLPPAWSARQSRLLQALGLLPRGHDLRREVEAALTAAVAAYYDARQGTFFLLAPDPPASLLIHELQHALQDQRFGLAALVAPLRGPDADPDAGLAFRLLAEGEAFYVEQRFTAEERAAPPGELERRLAAFAGTPRRERERQDRARAQGDPAWLAAIDARARLPDLVYQELHAPYFQGAAAVSALLAQGGWARIDRLFRELPASTEQLLHPDKAPGGPAHDPPTRVALPDLSAELGPGWSLLATTTLGELHLRTLFEALEGQPRPGAGGGWDGDQVQAYARAGDDDGWPALAWFLVFDAPLDAQAFARALREAQPRAPPPLATAEVTVRGVHVLVVGGVPAERREAVRAAARARVRLGE